MSTATIVRHCGPGTGVAVCEALGLVVTTENDHVGSVFVSEHRTWQTQIVTDRLIVFKIQYGTVTAVAGAGWRPNHRPTMTFSHVLTGASLTPPVEFTFSKRPAIITGRDALPGVGSLAFTGLVQASEDSSDLQYLLLVPDKIKGSVHVIDVVTKRHLGYVAPLSTIANPLAVAAKNALVAVSGSGYGTGDTNIQIFARAATDWVPYAKILLAQVAIPRAIRFSCDGTHVILADSNLHQIRIQLYRVIDGQIAMEHKLHRCDLVRDIEECRGGWLFSEATTPTVLRFCAPSQSRSRSYVEVRLAFGKTDTLGITNIVAVPGFGLLLRTFGGTLELVQTGADVAMSSMTQARVLWMLAVYRAIRAQGC